MAVLDGLRAVAILAVMAFHYAVRWTPPHSDTDLYPYHGFFTHLPVLGPALDYGWAGVGAVLCHLRLRHLHDARALQRPVGFRPPPPCPPLAGHAGLRLDHHGRRPVRAGAVEGGPAELPLIHALHRPQPLRQLARPERARLGRWRLLDPVDRGALLHHGRVDLRPVRQALPARPDGGDAGLVPGRGEDVPLPAPGLGVAGAAADLPPLFRVRRRPLSPERGPQADRRGDRRRGAIRGCDLRSGLAQLRLSGGRPHRFRHRQRDDRRRLRPLRDRQPAGGAVRLGALGQARRGVLLALLDPLCGRDRADRASVQGHAVARSPSSWWLRR